MLFGCDYIDRTGEIRENKHGTQMEIIAYRDNMDIDIEFLDEFHYIKRHQAYSNFKTGGVKNPYDVTVNGVGYIGVGKYKTTQEDNPQRHTDEYNTWVTMLYRCYCDEDTVYFKESLVCKEWLCYQNFAEWYSQNKYEVKGRLHLDKDILCPGNKVYSPDKCLLVPQRINMLFMNKPNKYGLPSGISFTDSKRYHTDYNGKGIGNFDTLDEAIQAHTDAKRKHIREVAKEYKEIIPVKVYDALMNW